METPLSSPLPPPLPPSPLFSSGGWGDSDEQVFYSLGPVNGLVGGESVSHAHTLHVYISITGFLFQIIFELSN